jgi:MoxR-like ATPase
VQAIPGFTLIATANDRDRGVNEMSSALKRRFNTVVLPLPDNADAEIEIVSRRVAEMGRALQLPAEPPALAEVRRVVQVFRELRSGVTSDGRTTLKVPTGSLSTAEAISVLTNGMTLAVHFGDGQLKASDVAAGLVGAVVKDPVHDAVAWNEYLEAVVKERDNWRDLYRACRGLTVAAG